MAGEGRETVTTTQAAEMLRVSTATVRRLIADGVLTAVNEEKSALLRPRTYLLDKAEVERFKQKGRRAAEQQ